ncbi:AAA family ATPase [Pseudomonas corrugata]|uniref:AAA family ATPase n=1 Tax=Pseudomonas corrugata TaxID=47879 RepID=UPI000465BC1C|nr:AAA family ATPase [Pseudomonas corrugata]
MSTIEQEPVALDDFESWLNGRPKWLQTAARMMIDAKRQLSEGEIKELSRLCQLEAKGQPDPGFLGIVPGTLSQAATRPPVRIDEILDVHGLNAIKAGANLPFGSSNLAVIYGQNGTGKSGFARLLKQICGSRSKDEIRSNVFDPTPTECRAHFKVSVDGNSVDVHWDIPSGPHKALRQAQVFDSKAAQQYMGRTEACYEPSRMKFVSALITTADAVNAELTREKERLNGGLPAVPGALSSTAEAKWLQTLKSTTTTSSIDKECLYTEELDRERIEKEALLAEKDISGRLQAIDKEKTALKSIETTLLALQLGSNDVAVLELVDLNDKAVKARKVSEEAATAIFGKAELEGVGSATWQQMWEHARAYSSAAAYPESAFPNVSPGSRCVLCHQNLDDAAKARLAGFEKFVTDGLETAAKKAETALADRKRRIPALPSQADWLVHMSTLGFEKAEAESWLSLLKTRLERLAQGAPLDSQQPFDWSKINEAVKKKSAILAIEEASLAALQKDEHRQAMQQRVQTLQAKQWLSQNKTSIVAEKARLTGVASLDKASRSAATNSLTTKKNELAKTELDAGYQTRFVNELKLLGGHRIPVSPQSKSGGKGKITFGLNLVGAHGTHGPEYILSEGETRIAALAAFLADTTGSNQLAPFIFDDPISSLDQDFEEKVVERLVQLSHTRQVIIFTHRLSLVSLVDSVTDKLSKTSGMSAIKPSLTSLRRMDKTAGIVATQSARDAKPANAVKGLIDHTIKRLKKHQENAEVDSYEVLAKSACSDFRIIVEKTIEFILLADVVGRFRRAINTQGKLHKVANVTTDDCSFIDDLMTRYSVFEHAQSEELPSSALELAVFEADVTALHNWIAEFSARK